MSEVAIFVTTHELDLHERPPTPASAQVQTTPGLIAWATRSRARQVATGLGAIVVASAATAALRPLIGRTPYIFEFAAVLVAASTIGVSGGILAAVVSVIVVDYSIIPPTGAFSTIATTDVVSVVAFLAISLAISIIASALRSVRVNLANTNARLLEQTVELEGRQVESESLATELEHSNVELETALEDANEARSLAAANEQRLRMLDEASRVLGSSLDYEKTIEAAARTAVPHFADWCGVDLLVDGELQRLALAHVDPTRVRWARELATRYPPNANANTGVAKVIRTGEPELIPVVTPEMLAGAARDEEHLATLREAGLESVMIVPLKARGQTLGAMTLVSSRPERRFDERTLAVAVDLARRVAVAIDNARLYRAALAANEAKANFLATMSHELRTPLAAIIGYEELLIDGITGAINDAQRQQLQRIKASATHLLSLIDEILLYARLEAGREVVRIEPVVAKGVVDDAVAFTAPSLGGRAVQLSVAPIDPSLMLRTDAGKLRQMLLNLLTNAIKFTSSGTITVRVRDAGDRVVFEVQDTGVGITAENAERIFDPFWQVEQHMTRTVGGSGLGLSVTRRLANLLGGEVSVESKPGSGSTFCITLPKNFPVPMSATAPRGDG